MLICLRAFGHICKVNPVAFMQGRLYEKRQKPVLGGLWRFF
ncbi:non-canonical purine NTP pyrophosphatase [Acetobacter orientalis]|uniref:Non-canonical purine NTP pyrophosphatase n=1 Tax=Acetobacter orientalis TaxID=146474 RepID=A0A2Z5ZIX2_9PROT|nr:non-canonical purine NTP pyrophosphatase [Acetobacter orientalis]